MLSPGVVPVVPQFGVLNPGCEHVGQALRFCLSDLVKIKDVPARTSTARKLGLDLGEQTPNTKGAGLHGCWFSRAQRLSCGEQPGRQSRPCDSRVEQLLAEVETGSW